MVQSQQSDLAQAQTDAVPMGKRPQILTLRQHVYMHLMHRSPFYILFVLSVRGRRNVGLLFKLFFS